MDKQSDGKPTTRTESVIMSNSPSNENAPCRVLPPMPPYSLPMMPNEILEMIFGYLPQQAIQSLRLTNSKFAEIATFNLYTEPSFASTYRFAQFVHVVSRNPQYALLVRSLDLSEFKLQPCDTTGVYPGLCSPCGSWREFKYRDEDMYYIPEDFDRALTPESRPSKPWPKGIWRKQRSLASWGTLRKLGMTGAQTSSHPPPSPLLRRHNRQRDIPIGALCHVFAACRGLKKVNLSRVHLAHDDICLPAGNDRRKDPPFDPNQFVTRVPITSPDPSHTWSIPPHYPGAEKHSFLSRPPPESLPIIFKFTLDKCDGLINTFSSDIAKPLKRLRKLRTIDPDEIFYWLCTLKELEEVNLSHCIWVTTRRVKILLTDAARSGDELGDGKMAKGLKTLDLAGCRVWETTRHVKHCSWATKGSREEIERCVHEWIEEGGGEDYSLRNSCWSCSGNVCGCRYYLDNDPVEYR